MTRKPAIRISDVIQLCEGDSLEGGRLDRPLPSSGYEGHSLELIGWAVGRRSRGVRVEVLSEGRLIAHGPLGRPRPDIGEAFDEFPAAAESGFHLMVGGLDLDRDFEVDVVVHFEDGGRSRLARIRGERRSLEPAGAGTVQPLMITTIGRSGSKWLAWLLSRHPQIVAFQPMEYEPRVLTYWIEALRAVIRPRSFLSQLHTTDMQGQSWWLGNDDAAPASPVDPEVMRHLDGEALEVTARFCKTQVEAFYDAVTRAEGKPDAKFFAEKFLLEPALLSLAEEAFPEGRELILVRDFRDRLASVLAWNVKQGVEGFGRERFETDAEYVSSRVKQEAEALARRWTERRDSAHLVRYEDLLGDPRTTLEAILEFLGLDHDDDVLGQTLDAAMAGAGQMTAHQTAARVSETVGRWRRDLPPELAELCSEAVGPALLALGYADEPTHH